MMVLRVAMIVIALAMGYTLLHPPPHYTANMCEMSYMRPSYRPLPPLPSTLYSAVQYVEGMSSFRARSGPKTGLLFLPGNAGSASQVRSLGGAAAGLGTPLEVYALDVGEEKSALQGQALLGQAQAAIHVMEALTLSHNIRQWVLVGHSMGGVVARMVGEMLLSSNNASRVAMASPGSLLAVVTLASPQGKPPLAVDGTMQEIYHTWLADPAGAGRTIPLLSLHGGPRDTLIPPHLARMGLQSLPLSLVRESMEVASMGVSADHQCVLWCRQIVATLARWLDHIESRPQLRADPQHLFASMVSHFAPELSSTSTTSTMSTLRSPCAPSSRRGRGGSRLIVLSSSAAPGSWHVVTSSQSSRGARELPGYWARVLKAKSFVLVPDHGQEELEIVGQDPDALQSWCASGLQLDPSSLSPLFTALGVLPVWDVDEGAVAGVYNVETESVRWLYQRPSPVAVWDMDTPGAGTGSSPLIVFSLEKERGPGQASVSYVGTFGLWVRMHMYALPGYGSMAAILCGLFSALGLGSSPVRDLFTLLGLGLAALWEGSSIALALGGVGVYAVVAVVVWVLLAGVSRCASPLGVLGMSRVTRMGLVCLGAAMAIGAGSCSLCVLILGLALARQLEASMVAAFVMALLPSFANLWVVLESGGLHRAQGPLTTYLELLSPVLALFVVVYVPSSAFGRTSRGVRQLDSLAAIFVVPLLLFLSSRLYFLHLGLYSSFLLSLFFSHHV